MDEVLEISMCLMSSQEEWGANGWRGRTKRSWLDRSQSPWPWPFTKDPLALGCRDSRCWSWCCYLCAIGPAPMEPTHLSRWWPHPSPALYREARICRSWRHVLRSRWRRISWRLWSQRPGTQSGNLTRSQCRARHLRGQVCGAALPVRSGFQRRLSVLDTEVARRFRTGTAGNATSRDNRQSVAHWGGHCSNLWGMPDPEPKRSHGTRPWPLKTSWRWWSGRTGGVPIRVCHWRCSCQTAIGECPWRGWTTAKAILLRIVCLLLRSSTLGIVAVTEVSMRGQWMALRSGPLVRLKLLATFNVSPWTLRCWWRISQRPDLSQKLDGAGLLDASSPTRRTPAASTVQCVICILVRATSPNLDDLIAAAEHVGGRSPKRDIQHSGVICRNV